MEAAFEGSDGEDDGSKVRLCRDLKSRILRRSIGRREEVASYKTYRIICVLLMVFLRGARGGGGVW